MGKRSTIRFLFGAYSWFLLCTGILGFIPGFPVWTMPDWFALLKVGLGIFGIWMAMSRIE